jgi:hypothetical protein
LTQAINYLQTCYELDSKKFDQNNFAQGIWGSCLYYLAKLKTSQDSNDYEREPKVRNKMILFICVLVKTSIKIIYFIMKKKNNNF